MGRGAPNKKGLDYFPKMVDFYEDDKIFDLLDRYGPLGVTVYDCILCIVYKHGYYAEIPLDKLSKMIVKMIGNKWVKSKKAVVQVVHFCSEIGLLDDALMTENIITSVGIQKRFYRIAVKLMKRRLYDDRYWLLGKAEDEEPLLNAPLSQISSEENRITSEENNNSSEKSTVKEKKNKYIDIDTAAPGTPFPNQELESAFQLFLVCREKNGGKLLPEQVQGLREELLELSDDDQERIAIVKRSVTRGWKGFYPIKGKDGKKQTGKRAPSKNRFHNFDEREYDMRALERQLLSSGPDQNRPGGETPCDGS